jgi:predicted transcriptional regulator
MDAVRSSEISLKFYQTTRHNNAEDGIQVTAMKTSHENNVVVIK